MEVFKTQGFDCKHFLPSPPPPRLSYFVLAPISRGQNTLLWSFFACQPHRNACYAGWSSQKVLISLGCRQTETKLGCVVKELENAIISHIFKYPNNFLSFSNNAQSSYNERAKNLKLQVTLHSVKIQPIIDPLTSSTSLTICITNAIFVLKLFAPGHLFMIKVRKVK